MCALTMTYLALGFSLELAKPSEKALCRVEMFKRMPSNRSF